MIMASAAVIGLTPASKRLLSSTFYYSDIAEKLACDPHYQIASSKNGGAPKKLSGSISNRRPHRDAISSEQPWLTKAAAAAAASCVLSEQTSDDTEHAAVDAILVLQKLMLEKQWNLSVDTAMLAVVQKEKSSDTTSEVVCSGISARRRRIDHKRKLVRGKAYSNAQPSTSEHLRGSRISPELVRNRWKGYVKGVVSEELLTHAEVVQLSQKIRAGLLLDEHKDSLRERLGCEPSDEQLANYLEISRTALQSKVIECSLAREKLAMSNIRLVMSIAQRYDSTGVEMADLVQGGLIGLLRGIEKFDSSKGFKISTYVYWWIRQGVSRALVENSRTLRLPTHLHERLNMIRNAKARLEEKGINPSIDRIAESLNMSQKKVQNATEASNKIFSLDREAFPSLNGLPGQSLHSYIADNHVENNPWHGVDEWALKDEVDRLITSTLREREREIIRLYYGLKGECLTWEEISKRMGLSRERVRQVGLVSLEKLKNAARKKQLDAMLVLH